MRDDYDPSVDRSTAEAWRRSRSTPLIGLWWTLFLMSNWLDKVEMRLWRDVETPRQLLDANYASIMIAMAGILAAVATVILVRAVQVRQDKTSGLTGLIDGSTPMSAFA